MRNKLKPLFSLTAIIVFLLLALASFGPDASTNTSVAIKDCMTEPAVSGTVKISISYKDKDGVPIPNASGVVYVWRQEAKDDGSCTWTGLSLIALPEDIFTDAAGTFSIDGYPYTLNNKADLHRVELIIEKSAIYTGCREVQVIKYGSPTVFTFNCVGLRLNEL